MLVFLFVGTQELLEIAFETGLLSRRRRVRFEVRNVKAVQRAARARVCTAGNVHHTRGSGALPMHQARLGGIMKIGAVDQFVAGDIGFIRSPCVPVVHVVVGTTDLADTARVSPINVNQ